MMNNIGGEDLGVTYENFSWEAIKKIVSLAEFSKSCVAGDKVAISFTDFFDLGKVELKCRDEWRKGICQYSKEAANERRKIGADLEGLTYDPTSSKLDSKLL